MYFLNEKKMISKGTVTIVEAASCRFKIEFGPVVSDAPRKPTIRPLLTKRWFVYIELVTKLGQI